MEAISVFGVITAAAATVAAGAAVWALRYAKSQIETAIHDRQVDRVLALHSDFTTGEVGAARSRLAS